MKKEDFDALVLKVGEAAAIEIKREMEIAQKALDLKILEATKGKATKEEVETIVKEAVEAASLAAKTAYEAVLKVQGEAIGELKLSAKSEKEGKKVSFTKALMNAFEEQRELFNEIIKSGKQNAPFVVTVDKAAVTMTEANTIGAGATQVTLSDDTGIISGIRRREEKYLQSVSVGSISNSRAIWIEETDPQGTPIFIAEGAGKIQLSSLWVEKSATVKKIGVFGKVTTELMSDLPQLVSFIKNTLMKRMSIVIEDQLLTGDNVGNNLNGAKTLATAFSAGDNAASIAFANEFDVLSAIALQVQIAHGIANAVFINPSTWAKMKGLKDNQGMPIWKQYMDPITKDVVYDGMRIVPTTAITADEFVGGDMTVLHVLYREQMSVQIGLDGSDFTNNLKTILVEARLVQFASANDVAVLVKGDFTAAKAALLEV